MVNQFALWFWGLITPFIENQSYGDIHSDWGLFCYWCKTGYLADCLMDNYAVPYLEIITHLIWLAIPLVLGFFLLKLIYKLIFERWLI